MAEDRSNRRVAGLSVRRSGIHGQGVFATRAFPTGALVLEIDDSGPVLDRGHLTPDQEIFIDVFIAADGEPKATWMKSPEKFINHSCEPNSYVRTDMSSGVRRNWALKNIRRGDEVTWDYAINSWKEWIGPVPCKCGAENCRRIVRGNFFTLPREIQLRYLPHLDEPFQKRFTRELRSLTLGAGRNALSPPRRA